MIQIYKFIVDQFVFFFFVYNIYNILSFLPPPYSFLWNSFPSFTVWII